MMEVYEPIKQITLKSKDLTDVIAAGAVSKKYFTTGDWEQYSIYIKLKIENAENTAEILFYKKGEEPFIEKKTETEPIKKEGNVLYFPNMKG